MGVPYWTKQYQSSDEILCPKEYFKFVILDTDYIEFNKLHYIGTECVHVFFISLHLSYMY